MLGKTAPKIGDRVDELIGNIQKKLYGRDGGERVRDENIREELAAYVFDLRFDLDVWVHAEGEVLDRPTHARITRCRFTPRGRLVRHPRLLAWIRQRRRRAFSNPKTQHTISSHQQRLFFFYFHLASGPGLVGGNHARKSDVPAIRPVDIPPVSVGRPAAEDGHATGVVLVGFNVVLIGYVSAFSLNIAVELPVVVFSAERADGGRGVGGV
jgi:hypothetical protein